MKVTAGQRLLFLFHDTRNFIVRVYEGALEDNVPFLASGLTFDALLAAIPLALLILALIGHFLSAGALARQVEVHEYLLRMLPSRPEDGGPDPFAPIVTLAEGVVKSRGTLGLLGLPLFVWFSTRLFGSLRAALCQVFDTEETRSFLVGKLYDIALVIATGVLFVANTAFTEGVAIVMRRHGVSFLEYFAAQLIGFGFVVALCVMIFKYAPAHRVRWDTAVVAGLTCSVFVEVAKQALSFYFQRFVRPDQLVSDATLGAIILFVGWVYYMTVVFLVGGQIAQVYEFRRRQAAQRAILSD
ncbi:MAG: YihY/virulence factor BrkB family protein [Gemmatimonadales bacterium]